MSEELPFKTDYAKSSRSKCKGCKNQIDQGLLRLAVMVQVFISTTINFSTKKEKKKFSLK